MHSNVHIGGHTQNEAYDKSCLAPPKLYMHPKCYYSSYRKKRKDRICAWTMFSSLPDLTDSQPLFYVKTF